MTRADPTGVRGDQRAATASSMEAAPTRDRPAGSPPVLLLCDPRFLDHLPGPEHPEGPERLAAILRAIDPPPAGAVLRAPGRAATREELERVHAPGHVDAILALRGRTAALDHETLVSPGSVAAAEWAAGAAVELVDEVLDGGARCGFALVRPPGHHATGDRAMGYCLFNHAAVGAAHALSRGLDRVLVVDWDVHHGNGTQDLFAARRDVLFFSLHQERLFPDGGGAEEIGTGEGRGFTLNLPLPPGSGDGDYLAALRRLLVPAATRYLPELVIVSCGFDAHRDEPTAAMEVTTEGFAALAGAVRDLAARVAGGRLLFVLEGGYDVGSLGRCARRTVEVLAGGAAAPCAAAVSPEVTRRIARLRAEHPLFREEPHG